MWEGMMGWWAPLKIHVHLQTQNAILFGSKIFADIISEGLQDKIISDLEEKEANSNDWCPYNKRRRFRETHRDEDPVKMKQR